MSNNCQKIPEVSFSKPGLVILCVFMCFGCNAQPSLPDNETVKAVRLLKTIPASVSENGMIVNYIDSIGIYYYRNLVLYELFSLKSTLETQIDQNGEEVGQKRTIEPALGYYVYALGDAKGFYYDSTRRHMSPPSGVDSFLTGFCSLNPALFDMQPFRLVNSRKEAGPYDLIENYVATSKKGDSFSDSTEYFYSGKMNWVPYSFSKKMDDRMKMKLVKFRFIYNAGFSEQYSMHLPKRELTFELRPLTVTNYPALISLIKRLAAASGLQIAEAKTAVLSPHG